MKPRPGSSEVYEILVPCALAPGGKHEIKLRLRLSDNRVTFEDACNRRTAEANDALARSIETPHRNELRDVMSCRPWVDNMRLAIHARQTQAAWDLVRCRTCDAIVPLWHNVCPFQDRGSPVHTIERGSDNLGFWKRIVRSGRVR